MLCNTFIAHSTKYASQLYYFKELNWKKNVLFFVYPLLIKSMRQRHIKLNWLKWKRLTLSADVVFLGNRHNVQMQFCSNQPNIQTPIFNQQKYRHTILDINCKFLKFQKIQQLNKATNQVTNTVTSGLEIIINTKFSSILNLLTLLKNKNVW